MKLKLDKSFSDFLRSGRASKILPIIILGILMVLLGSVIGSTEKEAAVEPTEEQRLSQMLSSVEGVGECRVMITYSDGGEVFSVAVLCEGADSVRVRGRVIELVSSLYGIGSNRIAVLPSGD